MKRIFLFIIIIVGLHAKASAQFYFLHAEYRNDWYPGTYPLNPNFSAIGYDQVTVQAQSSNDQFVLERNSNNNKWFASGINYNTIYTATHGNIPSPDSYLATPTSIGKYYTHVVEYNPYNGGYSDSRAIVMETSNAPVNISTVTPYGRVCGLNNAFTLKIDLSANKSPEEVVYVRYCQGNNFGGGATGVIRVNFQSATSNSGYAYIPMSGAGLPTLNNNDVVYYYIFSSTVTGITSAMSQNDINLYTLRVNTNGAIGTNFNFTINTSYYSALPLAGTYNVSSSAAPDMIDGNYTFSSLNKAISTLDSNGVAANVIFNIPTGFTETAPPGGYQVVYKNNNIGCNGLAAVPLANQSNASQTVSFQASGIGANPLLTAFSPQTSGSIMDAVVKIIGADYIKFDSIDVRENPANTNNLASLNNMTEFGYALFYASATNGAQYNEIRKCNISLNRTYANTFGIYSNVRHTATSGTSAADISAASGSNSNNKFYANNISNVNRGITLVGSNSPAFMDVNNDVGGSSASTGNNITNWGGLGPVSGYVSASITVSGIYCNHQKSLSVQYNLLNSGATGTTVSMSGIAIDYSAGAPTGIFTNTVSYNTISISTAGSGVNFYGIHADNGVSTSNLTISNNILQNCQIAPASSGPTARIINVAGNYADLNINNNTFSGHTSTQSAGSWMGILNQANTVNLNINQNKVGGITFNSNVPSNIYMIYNSGTFSSSGNINNDTITDIVFNTGLSGSYSLIYNTAAGSASSLSISNNLFQNISLNVGASANFVMINNTAAALMENINSNQFKALSLNTTGGITFILNTNTLPAGGTKNVNNNAIITSFAKTSSGSSIYFYQDLGTSPNGTTVNNNNNNFSNITAAGATNIGGWANSDGGVNSGPNKTISGNKFNNISTGNAYVFLIDINNGSSNLIFNDTISNITSATNSSSVQAIRVGASGSAALFSIYQNIINNLSATGTGSSIYGMYAGSGTTVNIYRNWLYNFSSSANTTFADVYGIYILGGNTVNVYNNMISGLQAATALDAIAVAGIYQNANTVLSLYFNTILLSGSVSGTGGSAGIYNSGTAGTNDIRNNIIINKITPSGSGISAAYRRGTTSLATYAVTSNNNLFYAGIPSASKLIYYDGTNSDQTLATFQTRVAPRESASISSDLTFANAAAGDLHLDVSDFCIVAEKAQAIATYTTDYDLDTRNATKPTIGADEAFGQTIYSVPVGSCGSTNTVTTVTCGSLSGSNWVYFIHPATRKVVAAINPNGSNLGTVTVKMYNLNNSFSALQTLSDHYGFNWYYLNKIWNITASGSITTGHEPSVRFYYTPTEFSDFVNAAGCGNLGGTCTDEDMVLLQATGLSDDCDATNNGTASAYNFFWYKNPANYANEVRHIEAYGLWATVPQYAGPVNFYGDIASGMGSVVSSSNTEFDGRYFQATVNSFSEFRLFLPPQRVLSVEWNSFSGRWVNDGYSLLNWSTSTERDIVSFEIERSNDGQRFSVIGSVNAIGNSNAIYHYSFRDMNTRPGRNYYRIKAIDANGRINYSTVVMITVAGRSLIADIYPNPVQHELNCSVISPASTAISIRILSVSGKLLKEKKSTVIAGANHIKWDVSELPAGTYFLQIGSENLSNIVKQFVKQ
jgi:hypothetical protein